MGFFDVPTVERKPWGILGLILNIVFSGVGNIVAGAKDGHKNSIVRGILQLVLVWTIVAWVWSIVDGVRIFKASAGATWSTPAVAAAAAPEPAPAAAPAAAPKAAAKKAPAKKAAAKAAPKKAAPKSAKKAAK